MTYRVAIFLLLALGAAAAGVLLQPDEHYFSMRDFTVSHFAVDYQSFGLVRRGLIGSLVAIDPDPASGAAVARLSFALLGLTVLAAAAFVAAQGAQAPPMLLAAFALSPATFLNFGYDLGRFDQAGFILMLASLATLRRGVLWPAVAAAVVGVLIHEAYLVLFLPMIVALAQAWNLRHWPAPLLAGLAAFAAVTASRPEPEAVRAFFAAFGPDYYPVRIWTTGFDDSVAYATAHFIHPDTLRWAVLPTLAFLAPVVGTLAAGVWRADRGLALAAAAALSPALMSLTGIDLARWAAIATLNLFVLAVLSARAQARWHAALIPLAGLGPIGVAWAFPVWLAGPG